MNIERLVAEQGARIERLERSRRRDRVLLIAALAIGPFWLSAGSVSGLQSFTTGQLADAAAVNANFQAVKSAVDGNATDIAGKMGLDGTETVTGAKTFTQWVNTRGVRLENLSGGQYPGADSTNGYIYFYNGCLAATMPGTNAVKYVTCP